MKIIFLDIDGVLNNENTFINNRNVYEATGTRLPDLEEKKIELLKKIVEATNAEIVLSSTWRYHWKKEFIGDKNQGFLGKWLDEMFQKVGLTIFDKTPSINDDRGLEISTWLSNRNDVTNWIVIDDEIFSDFEKHGILPRLIKTDFYNKNGKEGGLLEEHVEKAISLLNAN